MKFKKSQTQLPTTRTDYPFGSYVKTEKGYFYIKDNAKRYRIISERCLNSWSPHRVIETTESAVQHLRIAARLKFRNGSLIWNISDGRIYLVENGLRRHIVSPDALTRIGAVAKDVVCVSIEEINLHEQGKDLA